MFSLNRIQLIGYLTQPVDHRQTPGGQSVSDINICTPYTFTAEKGGELSGFAYHSVTAWGGMADVAAQYMRPGAQVFVSGRLQTDTWEDQQTKEKRSKTRVVAMDLILLDPRDGQITLEGSGKKLSQCMNRIDVIGNTTRDPELRTTTGGQSVLTIGVATNERWRDKASGEDRERTEFHNVVLWGDLAKTAAENVKKGMRVHVSGRVQTRSWETTAGSKRTTTEVIADTLSILGVKNTDITISNESRRPGSTAQQAKRETELEPSPVAAGDVTLPEVKYESEVKVEDLPF